MRAARLIAAAILAALLCTVAAVGLESVTDAARLRLPCPDTLSLDILRDAREFLAEPEVPADVVTFDQHLAFQRSRTERRDSLARRVDLLLSNCRQGE